MTGLLRIAQKRASDKGVESRYMLIGVVLLLPLRGGREHSRVVEAITGVVGFAGELR